MKGEFYNHARGLTKISILIKNMNSISLFQII